eukprot:1156585-Pelagomonas_calceolata.AAC.4
MSSGGQVKRSWRTATLYLAALRTREQKLCKSCQGDCITNNDVSAFSRTRLSFAALTAVKVSKFTTFAFHVLASRMCSVAILGVALSEQIIFIDLITKGVV